ncbi:hypothetical protein G6F57_008400 [Rhizopus arrhizus]|uniref:Uncharacterized protein n=1 Tax=Rhizopus oryzae TaxID=64495 RepID=A0A9P6X5D5_RHIOR|nr:hypothetical protein G6F23_003445 [Rhizopus arrhizus]KAG1418513.1 hypothetical protein G6F58_005051 [Rhizopus delemar]KAG0762704.1 hypothetical protein G6F24_006599 [Rhizopus arrhizus]KAG0786788.1 hypothetical protein G6F21_008349 [Rhizopus arrhizus]KAG0801315.1 hypothetical protein G6F22_001371 [Rhizopus arrhizus]
MAFEIDLNEISELFSFVSETEQQDALDVFDALIEVQDQQHRSFDQDYLLIHCALELNQEMQQETIQHITAIDQQITRISHMLANIKKLANEEASLKTLKKHGSVHKPVQIFDASELLECDEMQEQDETRTDKERKKLFEGIHSEAKRALAHEFIKKNEPWRIWEVDKTDTKILENYPVSKIDWHRVSFCHVICRDPNECLMQWTTQEHPTINKRPWRKQEAEKLNSLVACHGEKGQWEKIANELGTNRTISQCFSRYMANKNAKEQTGTKWTQQEDVRLTRAVKLLGDCNWQQIAAAIGGRTGQQCLQRWSKSIDPSIRRQRWQADEDEALKRAARLYGVGNWRLIQRLVPGRTDMQCRERWVNALDDSVRHGPFTEEEKEQVKALVEKHGPKWSYLATLMSGRTDNQIMKTYKAIKLQEERQQKSARKKDGVESVSSKIQKKVTAVPKDSLPKKKRLIPKRTKKPERLDEQQGKSKEEERKEKMEERELRKILREKRKLDNAPPKRSCKRAKSQ